MSHNDDRVTFATASDLLVMVQEATVEAMRRLPRDVHNPAIIGLILATHAITAADQSLKEEGLPADNATRVRLATLRREVGDLAGLRDDDEIPPAFRAAFDA